jgi:uncharacterized membrane protein YfcA
MRRVFPHVASMAFPLPLPDVPLAALVASPLIVLVGYTIFGATGFGSSAISVPGLAHFFPLTFTVPLITTTDAFAATATAYRLRRHVAWREFARLVPAMLIGMGIGATLLIHLPRDPALLALGVFVTAYGAYVLVGPRRIADAPGWLAWPIGVVGGVFSALFGTGGPIYMMFLSSRLDDKGTLRATSAIVVGMSIWIRLVLFLATGLLIDRTLAAMVLLLLPFELIGLWLGNRLHHALTRSGVFRLIAGLLVINGVTLIARAIQALRA